MLSLQECAPLLVGVYKKLKIVNVYFLQCQGLKT